MAKELRFNSPSKKLPAEITIGTLYEKLFPSNKLEIYIEWEDGTYGSKIPVVVIKAE